MASAEDKEKWKRRALNALKSGAIGAAIGALCAVLPEHLNAARVVCRLAAAFFGGF